MISVDPNQDYFRLFGLEAVFDIDTAALHSAQQKLQASCHPDRFAGASDREKRLSVQTASLVNQAYQTLRDPVKRSRYLLQLQGVEMPDESQTTSDAAFLMEQMELREAIDRARQSEDAMTQCAEIERELKQRMRELERQFAAALEAEAFDDALESSRKLQFIQRIIQQLDEILFELEGA